jgi:membrane protein
MRRQVLPLRVLARFVNERYLQTAAALSFSTLLAMVPSIAIALVIFARLPFSERAARALENFLLSHLLPADAGAIIARYVGEFAQESGHLTLIGGLALVATALAQMLTIEHALNAIWRVGENRPLLRRIAMHTLALLLGPVLFGGSLALTTYVASASYGWVEIPFWAEADLLEAVAFLFMVGAFALFYRVLRHVFNRGTVPVRRGGCSRLAAAFRGTRARHKGSHGALLIPHLGAPVSKMQLFSLCS